MVEELEELLEEKDPKKLVVRINSGGGSAFSGFEIANRLRGMETHVVTRNESAAMSAAAVIFLAGDEREVGGMGTATMFHGARGFIDILEFGPVEKLENVDVQAVKDKELDLLKSLNRSIVKMLKDNTKMSDEEIDDIVSNEKQLTSEEALDFGIATGTYEKSKVKASADDKKKEEDSEPVAGEEDPPAVEASAAEKDEGTAKESMQEDPPAEEPVAEANSEAEAPSVEGTVANESGSTMESDTGGAEIHAILSSATEEVHLCS